METLNLFQKGLSLEQIAQERNMSPSTIEGHVFNLVEKKLIPSDCFLKEAEIAEINLFLERQEGRFLRPLKDHFGDKYSYLQLKIATKLN